ncbi:hypothetical protein D3C73_1047760 [compost metagenome]
MPRPAIAMPTGSKFGVGRASAYMPTKGCITEEEKYKINVIIPICVKDKFNESLKIGYEAGMTACSASLIKWAKLIANSTG